MFTLHESFTRRARELVNEMENTCEFCKADSQQFSNSFVDKDERALRIVPILSIVSILYLSFFNDLSALFLLLCTALLIGIYSFEAFIVFYISMIPAQGLFVIGGTTIDTFLGVIFLFLFVLDYSKNRVVASIDRTTGSYILLLLMVMASSLYVSLVEGPDFSVFRSNVLVLTAALMFYLKCRVMRKDKIRYIMKTAFLTSCAISFSALHIVGTTVMNWGFPRLLIPNTNPGWLGIIIAMCTFFGVPAFQGKSIWNYLVIVFVLVINLQVILASQSRTAWVISLILILALFMDSKKALSRKGYFLFAVMIIIVFVAFIVVGWDLIYNRFVVSFERAGLTGVLSGRDILAKAGLETFKKFPFFGIGNSVILERQYVGDITGSYNIAHNGYVMVLLRFGLVGFLFFSFFILNVLRNLSKATQFKFIFLGVFFGYLFAVFGGANYFGDYYMIIIATIMGFCNDEHKKKRVIR